MHFLKFILIELIEPLNVCRWFFHSILESGAIISFKDPFAPLLFICLLILESPLNELFMIIGGSQSFVCFILFCLFFLFFQKGSSHLSFLQFYCFFFSFSVTIYYWASSEIFISFFLFNSRISIFLECWSLYLIIYLVRYYLKHPIEIQIWFI